MSEPFPLDLDLLQRVLDYLNDAVYITDRDRRIVLWNRKAEEVTGHPREKVVGHYCRDNILAHVDKEGRALCSTDLCPLYRAMIKDSPSRVPAIVYALTADRGRIPVSVSAAPIHGGQAEVVGAIEVFRDESETLKDLEFARGIQQHILTAKPPEFTALDLAVRYYTLALVGGDFYEIRKLAPETAGIMIADVRGHGVSAALYTMTLKSISENLRDVAHDPGEFMTATNRDLSKVALAEVFATAAYLVVEGETGEVRYSNAGHPPPLKIAADGRTSQLTGGDLPLGVDEVTRYAAYESELAPGETILLFSDGATEIADGAGRLLGVDGLGNLASKIDWRKPGAALESLHRALLDYSGGVEFLDDVLLLCCTRLKQPA